jgi:hypothetical protein
LVIASSDKLRHGLIVGSILSLLVAIASSIGLAASIVQPALDLHELYRLSTLTRTIGFCFLASYVVAGFAFPNKIARQRERKSLKLDSTALKIICGACFLLIMLSPYTYVYPQADRWITKSKAGTFSVSSEVAREYLWRDVRTWSAIPFCLSFSAATFMRKFSRRSSVTLPS